MEGEKGGMNRRKMFGFVATAPIGIVGSVVAVAGEKDIPTHELLTLTHGPGLEKMRLHANKIEPTETRTIGLGIGDDGGLWVKSEGGWKRVVVE